jgi:hypothetical protein
VSHVVRLPAHVRRARRLHTYIRAQYSVCSAMVPLVILAAIPIAIASPRLSPLAIPALGIIWGAAMAAVNDADLISAFAVGAANAAIAVALVLTVSAVARLIRARWQGAPRQRLR